jgi:hypothetical protein
MIVIRMGTIGYKLMQWVGWNGRAQNGLLGCLMQNEGRKKAH